MIAIENLTNEELQDIMVKVAREQEKRKTRAKEACWEPLKKSILAYLSEVGDLRIETWDTTYHINCRVCLDQIGVIDIESC